MVGRRLNASIREALDAPAIVLIRLGRFVLLTVQTMRLMMRPPRYFLLNR